MTRHFGVFIGRCQTPHNGHFQIIDQIIADGLEPVLVLGSIQESRTVKNPYTFEERCAMIRIKYPDIQIFGLEDNRNWDLWHESLLKKLHLLTDDMDHITIYTHSKPEDLKTFEFRGVEYTNEYFTHMFHIDGMKLKNIESSEHQIRASQIREDIDRYRDHLDPRIYQHIKELNIKV